MRGGKREMTVFISPDLLPEEDGSVPNDVGFEKNKPIFDEEDSGFGFCDECESPLDPSGRCPVCDFRKSKR
jgi:hypothetical protein